MLSELGNNFVISVSCEEENFVPEEPYKKPFPRKYSNYFDILLLFNPATQQFLHVCGSENDRYFFRVTGNCAHDRKLLFYRIRNFHSVSSADFYDSPVVAEEGGWEVCVYNERTGRITVLTAPGYRERVYPGGPIMWSPDGTKFLFAHAKEPFWLDKKNNEYTGVYVYDFHTERY